MEAILNKTITTEYAGQYSVIKLGTMLEYLLDIYQISHNKNMFVRKVMDGLTDETDHVSDADTKTLQDLYVAIWCDRYNN